MKKNLIVFFGTILSFFVGVVLFALVNWFLYVVRVTFEEGVFYDLFLGPLVGLILSALLTLFLKRRWNLSWGVWVAWVLGILVMISVLFLILATYPNRR